MTLSGTRVTAIVRKELREYRRNRSILSTMGIIPLVFVLNPVIQIFALRSSAAGVIAHSHVLLYMLGIPAIVPAVISAYSIVGERQQGSLEPLLTTPIPREELLLGKALAALIPALAIAYAVFGLVLVAIALFAAPGIASALLQPPDLLAQLLFSPLVAGWSIWLGIAVSGRTSDPRTAQQLGTLASVPSAIVAVLVAYDVIHPTVEVAVGAAALLVVLNVIGWRITSALFDRERLISSTR
jgi:ABC-type transport system involved in multi-copper enzyme maturation permease subunit